MKNFLSKIFIIILFLVCACAVFIVAEDYAIGTIYEDDELRVVIDSTEVTRNLPNEAKIVDGKIMFSQKTVDYYFDKYLYYDEKYDTLITTTETSVAKLKLNENKIDINGEEKEISVPAQKIDDTIYIPIEELSEVYQIKIKYNEKIIITEKDANSCVLTLGKDLPIKSKQKLLSRTVYNAKKGDIIEVYNFSDNDGWTIARTENGDLGYIDTTKIVVDEEKGIEFPLPQIEIPKMKINLIWEYAENYTPDRSSEGKIDAIDVVAPTWLFLNGSDGSIIDRTDAEYISWAKKQGYNVWAVIQNDTSGSGLAKTSSVVTDMKNREKVIDKIVELSKKYGYNGINVDFENMKKEDSAEFAQFIRELAATLRRNNLYVSVDVTVPDGSDTWSLCYNRKQIGEAADYVILMAYDEYGASSSIGGPVAGLDWVEANIKKMQKEDSIEYIEKDKLILGIPFYSRIWYFTDGEKTSTGAIAMDTAKEYLNKGNDTWLDDEAQSYVEINNGNRKTMLWVEDEKSLKEKLQLVNKYELAGTAYWRWNYESDTVWEVIEETLTK